MKIILSFLTAFLFLASSADAVPRIVGGERAPAGSWPSVVAVSPAGGLCGGTLVRPRWVLTAGHCLEGFSAYEVKVLSGGHALWRLRSSPVDKVIVHPQYEGDTLEKDIGLLRLRSPLQAPVARLPIAGEEYGNRVYAAGWGTTCYKECSISDHLLQVDMQLVGSATCKALYVGNVASNTLCATFPGKDTCQGDSGGPLETDTNRGRVLIGLTSSGWGCATFPGIYTEILPYISWLGDKIASAFSVDKRSLSFSKKFPSKMIHIQNRDQYQSTVSFTATRGFRAYPQSCMLAPQESCQVKVTRRGKQKRRGILTIKNSSGQVVRSLPLR